MVAVCLRTSQGHDVIPTDQDSLFVFCLQSVFGASIYSAK